MNELDPIWRLSWFILFYFDSLSFLLFHAVPHWFFRHFLLYSGHQDLFKLGQDIAMPAVHWRFGWDDESVEISPADSMFWGEFLMAMFQPQKVTIPVPHDPILDGLKPPIGWGWYPSSQQFVSELGPVPGGHGWGHQQSCQVQGTCGEHERMSHFSIL